jgi:hypothetical protein
LGKDTAGSGGAVRLLFGGGAWDTSAARHHSSARAKRRPAEQAERLAALRRAATLLRAIYFELIPARRAASLIGAAFRSLAPTRHPAIATLLAAEGLSDHGPEHTENLLECQFWGRPNDHRIENNKWSSEAFVWRGIWSTSAAVDDQAGIHVSGSFQSPS